MGHICSAKSERYLNVAYLHRVSVFRPHFLKFISPCRALFLSSRCCAFLEYHDISLPVVPPASIVPPHQVYFSVCYGTIVKFRTIFKCCAIDHTGVAWTPARSSVPPLFLHTYTTLCGICPSLACSMPITNVIIFDALSVCHHLFYEKIEVLPSRQALPPWHSCPSDPILVRRASAFKS